MSKFALERMDEIRGDQRFDKLVVDGVAQFDEFEKDVIGQYGAEFRSLLLIMNQVSEGYSLPKTKFHPYNKGEKGVREYEFKTRNLRAYAIEQPGGKIVVYGGTKARQRKDQNIFRKLKNEYLESINHDKRRIAKKS